MIDIKEIENELGQIGKTRTTVHVRLKGMPKGRLRGVQRGSKYYYYQVLKSAPRNKKASPSIHKDVSKADSEDPKKTVKKYTYKQIYIPKG